MSNTKKQNLYRCMATKMVLTGIMMVLFGSFVGVQELHAAIEIEQVSVEASGNDFMVAPGKVQLVVEPGENQQVELLVTNRLGEERTFQLAVEDVTGSLNPEETVVLLGDDRGPYSLKDYISIEETSVTLGHGERARIPVTVSVPGNAEPSGLYGSVLVSTRATDATDGEAVGASANSVLVTRISSLFFVVVPGDIAAEGSLAEFHTIPDQQFFSGGPVRFGIVFENTGSVHLNPFGKIEIKNMFGNEVASIEADPWFALPESVRFRELAWDAQNAFGRYTAEVVINRGYGDLIDTRKISFYVISWELMGAVPLSIFALVLLLRFAMRSFQIKRRS